MPRGNSGGRANEAGSVHRAAVAAYLAVHGLAGRPVRGLGPGALRVESLALESDERVDDVRCTLSDGRVLVIQAKRECGVDEHLRETLKQWVDQPPATRVNGEERQVLVGVAAARFKGRMAALPEALDRRRQTVPGVSSAPEREAIAAVTTELRATRQSSGESLPDDRCGHLLDVAFALLVDASRSSAPQRGEAGAWLEHLVGHDHGDNAFDVLQGFFQGQASRGSGSTVDDWLTALAEAGHPVEEQAQGSIGQRRMAERRALQGYRGRLAQEQDLLTLSRLAGPLPQMQVPELLESFRVDVGKADEGARRESFGLAQVARRWGSLVVTGQPGTGKSCALDQLAAAWAAHDDAPAPVLVRLRQLAPLVDRGPDLTLDRLVECAIATSPTSDHELLRSPMVHALRRGDAALLLDGLDECGSRAGIVADGIAALREAHPTTSIILTTRHSTAAEAAKVGLPVVDLETPQSLRSTLRRLVEHAAPSYDHAADNAWVRERQARVEQASTLDRGLWSVPLLATLMTLQITRRGTSVPVSRARLIADAVRESAERWLEQENALRSGQRSHVMPQMVVEGFADIAHALAGGAVVRRPTAVGAVGARLRGHWGKSPGEADALAAAVVDFWDGHVGAFLVGDDDVVTPRAVHLVEIGEALWVVAQHAPERERWVAAVIDAENHQEIAVLAAGLSAEVLGSLVEAAASRFPGSVARRRGLEWAARAATDLGADRAVSGGTYLALMDALATEASSSRSRPAAEEAANEPGRRAREARDGPGWRWVQHLASLPLPGELLTDALVDTSRTLTEPAVRACTALIELAEPDDGDTRVERASRRSLHVIPSGPRLLTGHAEAAALLARYPEVLDDDTVSKLHGVALAAPIDTYEVITTSLAAASRPTPPSLAEGLVEWARDWADSQPYRWFFEGAATCGAPAELERASRWTLDELARLAGLVRLSHASIPGLRRVADADADDVASILGALADAHGIDRDRLAARARYLLSADEEERRSFRRTVLVLEPPSTASRQPAAVVPPLLVDGLIDRFGHPSALLADAAANLLIATGDPTVGERLWARVPHMPVRRRWEAALVATLLAEHPADTAADLSTSPDGPTRAGSIRAAVLAAEAGDTRAAELAARSRDDPDVTVRLAAGAAQPQEWRSHRRCRRRTGPAPTARGTNRSTSSPAPRAHGERVPAHTRPPPR